jgi:hypothetical protein
LVGEGPTSTALEARVYPKAHVLNRFIAKLIDLFIVVAAGEIAPPVGFLSGLAYILIADGFAGGKSICKPCDWMAGIRPVSESRSSGIFHWVEHRSRIRSHTLDGSYLWPF